MQHKQHKQHKTIRRWAFWVVLVGFLAWDFARSPAIDLRQEPPLIAAGSGQVVSGGHCSAAPE